ncbi:MAG: response regulator [Roseiarcus sp.]|jgi:CheY-like chemotaxis protein
MTAALRECVLVVDDQALIADLWCCLLEDMGFEVCGTAPTAAAAIAMAEKHRPRVIIMDVRLRGELDGVDAALAIHESLDSKVIFITGSREPETMARIQRDRPTTVLFKPVSSRQFQSAVRDAFHPQ